MTYLVTGAAGFIGSNLVKELLIGGNSVVGIDNMNDYYATDLKELRIAELGQYPDFHFIKCDLKDKAKLLDVVTRFKPDTVIHLAAQAGVRLPVEQYFKYVDSNIVGFQNMLDIVISKGVPNFLYASSSSVYGDQSELPYSETETKLVPTSFYGITKLTNELLVNVLIPNSRTRARAMRFFTVYGPMGRPDMAYFRLINCALNDEEFSLFGNGTIERDFTYINDVVNSCISLANELSTRDAGYFDTVNIGGGKPVSMNHLIEIIEKQTAKKINIKTRPVNNADVRITKANDVLLKTLTNTETFTALDRGIQTTLEWASAENIKRELPHWIRSSI